jgi:hypothetical protein
MRCHTTCFSSSLKKTQLETSVAVRPQPRQISSNNVEQTATQGESLAANTRSAWGAADVFGDGSSEEAETDEGGNASVMGKHSTGTRPAPGYPRAA